MLGRFARWALAPIVLGLAMVGLVATPSQAVTGPNIAVDTTHDYVGLVTFYDANGDFLWRCSGTLLSPTVFLTAGHCTDIAEGAVSARVYMETYAGARYDAALGYDPVTGYPVSGGVESHHLYSYGFNDFAGYPNTLDVGLVVLDEPVQNVYPNIDSYASLAHPGTAEEIGTGVDAVVDVSGYGVTNANKNHTVSYRTRLGGSTFIINNHNQATAGYNLQLASNFGGGRVGTCFGDSGGPILVGGTDVVLAVNSFVKNGQCAGQGFAFRVDQQAVLDWMRQVLGDELFGQINIV